MNNTAFGGKGLFKYIEFTFFIKFIILFLFIYYFNIVFIALTDSHGKFFSSFLYNYLDYISWLRTSIIITSKFFVQSLGLQSNIVDKYTLAVPGGPGVIIIYPCLGYGIMSLWILFILAQDDTLQKKIKWCLIGIICIWFLNCWRVALLLIALAKKWNLNQFLNHHDIFNMVVYALIIMLMYIYIKQSKMSKI